MSKHWKLIVAGIVAAGVATTVAAKEYRSADVHPEDYPTVMAVKFMSDQIKQKTGGKDSIKVYTGNQLGGEKDTIEQVKIGALDLVRINVAPMNNICAETMVPTMPFLFKSKEHMRKVLDGPIGDQILKACEPQGYVGLAFYDSGSRSLYTTKKQVKTLADVKGSRSGSSSRTCGLRCCRRWAPTPRRFPTVRSTRPSRPVSWTARRTTGRRTTPRATSKSPRTIR